MMKPISPKLDLCQNHRSKAFSRSLCVVACLGFALPFTNNLTSYAQLGSALNSNLGAACSDTPIIGRVFIDKDKNGYANAGETGMADIQLYTAQGLRVTTDQEGRFHIACPSTPAGRLGSNLIVKLDEMSLPSAYHLTSENPRVIRMTPSQIGKVNFAVAPDKIISLDLSDDAFKPGSEDLKPEFSNQLTQIVDRLNGQDATLRITYYTSNRENSARIETINTQVRTLWNQKANGYRLNIERKTVSQKGHVSHLN